MGGQVAPHTGAWIETFTFLSWVNTALVAPHTGAWIETNLEHVQSLMSPVAPHTGAWIETNSNFWISSMIKSHPTRVRGLKPLSGLQK